MLAALGEPPDPALEAALGVGAATALRGAVAAHAVAVAGRVAPTVLVSTGVGVARSTRDVPFEEPSTGALTHALVAATGEHDGPLLLLAPDVPRIDARLVADALADLAEGCAISIASGFEARACLLALARPDPRLFELVAVGASRRAIVDLVEAAAAVGGEVGFLRHERRLVTPADARALAMDPLADPELRALASATL